MIVACLTKGMDEGLAELVGAAVGYRTETRDEDGASQAGDEARWTLMSRMHDA